MKGYPFERIDGGVKISDRQAAIDRFSAPGSDRFIFLICTRAGGVGINLTAADTVIIYDSDWNPQNDIQAQARCHRIGQDKAVKVYRLITNRTYEMEMFQKANMKLGLDKAVLNPLKQNIKTDGQVEMNVWARGVWDVETEQKGRRDAAEVRRVRSVQGGARGPLGGAEQRVLRGGHRADFGEEREGDHDRLAGRVVVQQSVLRDGLVGRNRHRRPELLDEDHRSEGPFAGRDGSPRSQEGGVQGSRRRRGSRGRRV